MRGARTSWRDGRPRRRGTKGHRHARTRSRRASHLEVQRRRLVTSEAGLDGGLFVRGADEVAVTQGPSLASVAIPLGASSTPPWRTRTPRESVNRGCGLRVEMLIVWGPRPTADSIGAIHVSQSVPVAGPAPMSRFSRRLVAERCHSATSGSDQPEVPFALARRGDGRWRRERSAGRGSAHCVPLAVLDPGNNTLDPRSVA